MWKFLLLTMLCILIVTPEAKSQVMSFGPQIGYQQAADADGGKLMGGVAFRAKVTNVFGIEGSIDYGDESFNNGAVTVRSWPVMVTGLIYPVPAIYGGMGVGWYNSTFDYNQSLPAYQNTADETKQTFGWHFGGGIEVPQGEPLKFVADLRYVFLDYNFTAVPGSSDIRSDFFLVTVGLQFEL